MAKQSGLHQIKGKVGEHSYYKQTGVSGGLIRSINQGMSARVKNSAEYANTRLNNQEFGAAADTAGLLGKMVVPKFRPMILPFSQSKMAKEVLRLARQNASPWGQRTVSSTQTAQLAAALAAMSKRDNTEFVSVSVSRSDASTITASVSFTAEQSSLLASLGIDQMVVTASAYNLATGQYDSFGHEMRTGYLERVDEQTVMDEPVTSGTGASSTEDLTVSAFVPSSGHTGHQIIVLVVTPIRTIDDIPHILQEYCSFTALQIPASV